MNKAARFAAYARRVGANLAALAVAGVAARATWDHIVSVGHQYGEEMAVWLPVSIDGMMIAGVILSVDAKVTGRPVNPWARAATWLGGLLSIGAQIESARTRGWIAMLIASIFSATLIITVEAVAWSSKRRARNAAVAEPVVQAQQVVEQASAALPVPVSPAPQQVPVSPDRVTPERIPGTGPVPRRKAISPLTRDEHGEPRVLLDRAPRV